MSTQGVACGLALLALQGIRGVFMTRPTKIPPHQRRGDERGRAAHLQDAVRTARPLIIWQDQVIVQSTSMPSWGKLDVSSQPTMVKCLHSVYGQMWLDNIRAGNVAQHQLHRRA